MLKITTTTTVFLLQLFNVSLVAESITNLHNFSPQNKKSVFFDYKNSSDTFFKNHS